MNEAEAKAALTEMLDGLTAGSILHLLAEVLRDSAQSDMDKHAREQVREAEAALIVVGIGLDAVLPR